jgi:hypothetical protein
MTIPKRFMMFLAAALLLSVLPACVESKHPLSDEKNSTVDAKLIGTWFLADDDMPWVVKRSETRKNALELTFSDEKGEQSATFFTTTFQSKRYASIDETDEEARGDPEKTVFEIYQYEFIDDDTVQVRGMEPAVLVKALGEKLLRGEFKVFNNDEPKDEGPNKKNTQGDQTPFITDSTDAIRNYLKAHADKCYSEKSEYPIIFKRKK